MDDRGKLKRGNPQGEVRPTLVSVTFKADPETIAVLEALVKREGPAGLRNKSAVIRRLILAAAPAAPDREIKGKTK